MEAAFLSTFIQILTGLVKAWLAEKDVVNSGVEKQQLVEEKQNNAQLTATLDSRNTFVPLSNDGLRAIKPNTDPDFRD